MHALRGRGLSRSQGGCGPHPHPRLQGPTQTHLAIYHHPQPRQLIASPRARPGARRGRSPRPARSAAGRRAAGLMARPPVPARPGAPWPSPMPLPLSAPRLASPRSGASLLGSAGAPGVPDGWAGTAWPRPGPAQPARRCEGRAPARELGDALGLPPRGTQADGPGGGCRPGLPRPARARDPVAARTRMERSAGLVSRVPQSSLPRGIPT